MKIFQHTDNCSFHTPQGERLADRIDRLLAVQRKQRIVREQDAALAIEHGAFAQLGTEPGGAVLVNHGAIRSRATRSLVSFAGPAVNLVLGLALVLTVAASEAAIGLAILVVFYRNRGSIAVEDINLMKG